MNTLSLALASVVASTAAQLLLRAGMRTNTTFAQEPSLPVLWAVATSPWVLLGLGLYAVSMCMWLGVLSQWEVSKAYPLVGLGLALTAVVGWVLGEALSVTRVTGVQLVGCGVVLLARS